MAKVTGGYFKKGKYDGIQLYEMDGIRYARAVSSLTRKKVKQHPVFAMTRVWNGRMEQASPIASAVYWQLPEAMRIDGLFNAMAGVVINLLKEGYTPEQAYDLLYQAAMSEQFVAAYTVEEDACFIASAIYWQLPAILRMDSYLYAMTGEAIQLLQEGFSKEQVYSFLHEAAMPKKPVMVREAIDVKQKVAQPTVAAVFIQDDSFADALLESVFCGVTIDEGVGVLDEGPT